MSLAQFDEIFEICCEFVTVAEMEKTIEVKKEWIAERNDYHRFPIGNRWWENAVRELDKENEKDLLYV
ncbi:hypothetical protein HHO41_15535 [Bacillus sp. DNRA2]|uniref:hypothetical protein n=1 Tax=Bacillus sp. DNRA2 TaxID=2723053 RepID=UPI00145F999E|nr:hypothetical protein [Bacillus sp. DNRA2]NMD71712.1 hypothetical protein [Bacillus sp. DNRA2]